MSGAQWMWVVWGAMAGAVGVYGWVWKRAGKRGRRWLEWGLVALVAGVSAASVATHEPWRDELHSWLVARELPLGRLWGEMACEGHFLPWYALLRLFAAGGAPVWAMGAVSWALNAVAVWLLVRRSPLTGWEKAAAGLSCVFLYVNPVIARPYVSAPLALFGAASLWGRRDGRPVAFGLCVAWLANTHVVFEGAAAMLAGVFAWENVLRRKDGKGWRECRRQWAGLGVMAAGGVVAAAQLLPSLWKSSVLLGKDWYGWTEDLKFFFAGCPFAAGQWAIGAALAWLGVEAWRKDRGAFWMYAAGLGYMGAFAVLLFPAVVMNRALAWWPVALGTAWALAGKGAGKASPGRVLAVTAIGVCLARPDLTAADARHPYDALPGACRWVAERFGDAEVWISGSDVCVEGAQAYFENVMDWKTGRRAKAFSWSSRKEAPAARPFPEWAEEVFRAHPEKEGFLAMASPTGGSGLADEDWTRPWVHVVHAGKGGGPWTTPVAVMWVERPYGRSGE